MIHRALGDAHWAFSKSCPNGVTCAKWVFLEMICLGVGCGVSATKDFE